MSELIQIGKVDWKDLAPRIGSLLIKPVSSSCNLDCDYCFYLERATDPYQNLPARRMTDETLKRLVKTYLQYSYPASIFVFQGGEPTLAGAGFYERLCALQMKYGREGQIISNSIQTNGVLLDGRWGALFRDFNWLVGLSLDGTEEMHDKYRVTKTGRGSWKETMRGLDALRRCQVDFNVLCVLNEANVTRTAELYAFFRSLGIEHLQFIPLAKFDSAGVPLPSSVTPEQYGRFLCELFDLWWPDRDSVHIRFFDNLLEALSGQKPTTCTMRESCDTYAVVEYNGDVYPCDFFVERSWKLGNLHADSWGAIASRSVRRSFATKKQAPHPVCGICEFKAICHGGCPKLRHSQRGQFEDLDYLCPSYKMVFQKTLAPLSGLLRKDIIST